MRVWLARLHSRAKKAPEVSTRLAVVHTRRSRDDFEWQFLSWSNSRGSAGISPRPRPSEVCVFRDPRDRALYPPPDPSGSNASKVVDITGLLVFVGDVVTDRFGKDIQEYDLKALAKFLSVSVSGVGSDELAERCIIADRCGVKVKTRRNREVKLTSELPPLVISTHERADVLVYN